MRARLLSALGSVMLAGVFLVGGPTPAEARPAPAAPVPGHPVLLISIDGLRPGDVLEAEQRGLKIPNLRRFLVEGAYAQGVTGVLPTLTYPSHTTLITGVAPKTHGIVNNLTFDPTAINQDGWYWYSSDLKAPTLWHLARAMGRTSGNVHWPVSVGAPITWNLPQIWRTGHGDDAKLVAALSTPGLLRELESTEGTYAPGKDEDVASDETRARFAIRLIARHRPDLMTVYLTGLDHTQHAEGPGSAPAHAVLERIDALVGQLVAAEQAARPDAVIAVASDHGFAGITQVINPSQALIDAGLIRLSPPDPLGRVSIAGWDAVVWASGGSFAIRLARDDNALRAKVRALLHTMQADPANRIERIIERADVVRLGGNPDADFYVNLGEGMAVTGFLKPGLPLRFPSPYKGTHGYFPDDPRMASTFLIKGPGIARGRNLGQIDMRAIEPTLEVEFGGSNGTAEAKPVAVRE